MIKSLFFKSSRATAPLHTLHCYNIHAFFSVEGIKKKNTANNIDLKKTDFVVSSTAFAFVLAI